MIIAPILSGSSSIALSLMCYSTIIYALDFVHRVVSADTVPEVDLAMNYLKYFDHILLNIGTALRVLY